MNRKERIRQLREESCRLRFQQNSIDRKVAKLELEQARDDHPCSCVKLNGDIEIYDMGEQEKRNRRGLGFGFVSECLSAIKTCSKCSGTGVPKDIAG